MHSSAFRSCFSFAGVPGASPRPEMELPKLPTNPKCIFRALLNAFGRGFKKSGVPELQITFFHGLENAFGAVSALLVPLVSLARR